MIPTAVLLAGDDPLAQLELRQRAGGDWNHLPVPKIDLEHEDYADLDLVPMGGLVDPSAARARSSARSVRSAARSVRSAARSARSTRALTAAAAGVDHNLDLEASASGSEASWDSAREAGLDHELGL